MPQRGGRGETAFALTTLSTPPAIAFLDPPAPHLEEAAAATCIQPGGGFCFELEQKWARVRRAYLRAVRPGYVRRMESLRSGSCEHCSHDVIDARDLKLIRNVCGWRFAPEHDPFHWREKIHLARTGLAEVVVATIVALVALLPAAAFASRHPQAWLLCGAIAFTWLEAIWFFRDPERVIPQDPSALLSPADGIISHVDEIEAPGFPSGRARRISIYLSPWDVHLNRNPRNARVVAVRYFRGKFLNARHRDCSVRNEQLWTDFVEPNGRLLRIKQISGKMARRLVCFLRVGEDVRAGERYGMIKYGSRTDVLFPLGENVDQLVTVGQRVYAGTSILLRFRERV